MTSQNVLIFNATSYVSQVFAKLVMFICECYQGPVRRLKPVNTGSHKHVTKTYKNAEEIPDPVVT